MQRIRAETNESRFLNVMGNFWRLQSDSMEIPQLTKVKQTKNTYKRIIRNLWLDP
jgi:hypothetical protein